MVTIPIAPIRYDASMESLEKDESETARELVETMRGISETVYKDSGHARRSVHAKSHGLLRGELTVLADLPQELAQGIFARAGTHDVFMRFSTNPGDILDDSISVPRGLALKIVGVAGDRLPGSEGADTQDFVMVNGPAFASSDAKAFLRNLKLLAATTDQPQILKKAASATLRSIETTIEAFGGESAAIKQMGGHPQTHPLGETYFTQVPVLYGEYVAKIALRPVAPALTALKDQPVDAKKRPNALREELATFFEAQGGEWELCAQLCTDLSAMPIEDASVVWPEDQSPYRPVARIVVKPQETWTEERKTSMDDGLSFSPWHGVAAHRPLGSIMRTRKQAYEVSAKFRSERNGIPISELET